MTHGSSTPRSTDGAQLDLTAKLACASAATRLGLDLVAPRGNPSRSRRRARGGGNLQPAARPARRRRRAEPIEAPGGYAPTGVGEIIDVSPR
jgi:hypothetical protein